MNVYIRIPKPSYLLSQLVPPEKPGAALYRAFTQVAERYQLDSIQECYRTPQSVNSTNFVVTTSRGKFIFRRHRLSKETVAHEHQVLNYLQKRDFPAPRMLLGEAGQAWTAIDGTLYSVYEFVEGYCPANFLWLPSVRRNVLYQAGRTLGEYHQAVAGLIPSYQKWDGYRPTGHRRWREGNWFRQALRDIRPLLQKPTMNSAIDNVARLYIDGIEHMLGLEPVVEGRSDLSKLVIHGDYAPWNVLFRPGQLPFILDFNAARLDLKIFDVILATFWFAWRGEYLDQNRATAFQAGYSETGQLRAVDIEMASPVFRWAIARAVAERLRRHYQEHVLIKNPKGIERFCKMCVCAEQHPQQLVTGLKGKER
jgi:Ser/Thr protein kinase RdoA (MazF antagonist)